MSANQSSTTLQAVSTRQAAPELPSAEAQQFLTFTLGSEHFAIAIQAIREIIEFPRLTAIPLTPAFLAGVINLRGAVVPVIDLSVRFGRARTGVGRRSCIVIVEVMMGEELQPLGVIVDAVDEVVEIDAAQIERRPDFGAGIRADFVSGMLRLGSSFVVALNLDRVLSGEELEQMIGLAGEAALQ
ncbi:chemotaxis protein CheW [Niveibacterium terrae]|uniref:chemotaxis protein CheW n=1 Tax=Niveibacterium terrae TaxID=3373598 RepID=UPI003A932C4B